MDLEALGKHTFTTASYLTCTPLAKRLVITSLLLSELNSTHVPHICFIDLIIPFQIASMAWTGIAATLLTRGQTVHSLFKLPVPVTECSTCNISPTSQQAAHIKSTALFIIDEASMIPSHALHAIDLLLRDLTKLDLPFGGKVMLLGGDFRQVLPVVRKATKVGILEQSIKSSPLWQCFNILSLSTNMRTHPDEIHFSKWLLDLGNGILHSKLPDKDPETIDIPDHTVVQDIVASVFPPTQSFSPVKAILTPKNDDCLILNQRILANLEGPAKTYYSSDSIISDDPQEHIQYPTEFINSITPSGMPPHRLDLKVGAVIMLLRNLDIKRHLCNGTRLIIRHLHDNVIDAQTITSQQRVLIPRIKLAPSDVHLPFVLCRYQFPIRLAYAMTINKAQGQTFDQIGIYLPQPVFSHGQLYVAFSRVRSFSDVTVHISPTTYQGHMKRITYTQNIVFKEILH